MAIARDPAVWRRSRSLGLVCALVVFLAAPPAGAQVRWDASFHEGVAERFLGNGDLQGGLGPVFGFQAEVAIAPRLRVGGYLDHELAPTGEHVPPRITSFGARAKMVLSSPDATLRWWVFAGFGYAAVVAPAYHQQLPLPNPATARIENQDVSVGAAGGNFLEVPFGIGGGLRLRDPIEFIVELSGRAGLGFSGSYYDPAGRNAVGVPTNTPVVLSPAGDDVFGLFLTAGLAIEL